MRRGDCGETARCQRHGARRAWRCDQDQRYTRQTLTYRARAITGQGGKSREYCRQRWLCAAFPPTSRAVCGRVVNASHPNPGRGPLSLRAQLVRSGSHAIGDDIARPRKSARAGKPHVMPIAVFADSSVHQSAIASTSQMVHSSRTPLVPPRLDLT